MTTSRHSVRIREVASAWVRYGYRRIHILQRHEDWPINVKRVRRLCLLEGQHLWAKRPREHVMAAQRLEQPQASQRHIIRAMDFLSDILSIGKIFQALTVVGAYTRECLVFHIDQGIKGEQLVDVIGRLWFERSQSPCKIMIDSDFEFISRVLDHRAYIDRATLNFSRPGKSMDNDLAESFTGRLLN